MYTPHTVTIYNFRENPDTLAPEYNITILCGVFLDCREAANIEKSGSRDVDAATLFVPFSVKAYEPKEIVKEAAMAGNAIAGVAIAGLTDREKKYISPKAFRRLADTTGYWTLEPSGVSSGVDSFFVKGAVIDYSGYAKMREMFDDVYHVTTVDTRDFGSADMQHWQVGAR